MVRCPDVVRRPFGSAKILVIHGIVVGLYYCSDRWKQSIYIIGLLEDRTPIPQCTEDNKLYVCLRCVELRMEHRHFIQQGIGNPLFRGSGQDAPVVRSVVVCDYGQKPEIDPEVDLRFVPTDPVFVHLLQI